MKTVSDSVAGMAAPTCLVQMKVSTLQPHCPSTATTRHDIIITTKISFYHPLFLSPSFLLLLLHFLSLSPIFTLPSPHVQDVPTHTQQMVSVRNINVEFSKETLETMLDGLSKICDQLSSVAKTS